MGNMGSIAVLKRFGMEYDKDKVDESGVRLAEELFKQHFGTPDSF